MRKIGSDVVIKEGAILGKNVIIDDNVYIDHYAIIRDNVHIKKDSYIGSGCVIGEYQSDCLLDRKNAKSPLLEIGEGAIIRSGTIIYSGSSIGKKFQTGHRATIRENCRLGDNVRVGTESDVQHSCVIGNYVSLHSNVFIGEKTILEDFVWLFPGVTITNDPTPPSNVLMPVTVKRYAVVCARVTILPGIVIGEGSLIGAGTVVTKNVDNEMVVVGNPGRVIDSIHNIKNKDTGENAYPWREHFDRGVPWSLR